MLSNLLWKINSAWQHLRNSQNDGERAHVVMSVRTHTLATVKILARFANIVNRSITTPLWMGCWSITETHPLPLTPSPHPFPGWEQHKAVRLATPKSSCAVVWISPSFVWFGFSKCPKRTLYYWSQFTVIMVSFANSSQNWRQLTISYFSCDSSFTLQTFFHPHGTI